MKEILPQTITLAESYIQIWRLNRKKTRVERMGETEEQIKADTLWKAPKEEREEREGNNNSNDAAKMEVENGKG